MVRALRIAVSFRSGVRDEVRLAWVARAGRYQGPALVIWGREDRIIPSCGHLVMAEEPAEFLAAFLPFLDRA